jgi:hypothetical protein
MKTSARLTPGALADEGSLPSLEDVHAATHSSIAAKTTTGRANRIESCLDVCMRPP